MFVYTFFARYIYEKSLVPNFGPNLLNRMERFSLIIKENEIKSFIKDERGSYGKTSAENMIFELKNIP